MIRKNYLGGSEIIDVPKPGKPDELRSIKIKTQKFNDCWAHSICRNFVRTLQILGVIKSKYNNDFYDLFYSILTTKKDCENGGNLSYLFILFDFLKYNYKERIFSIKSSKSKCFEDYCLGDEYIFLKNMTLEDKQEFILNMGYLFDNDILFIGKYTYLVNQSGNNKIPKAIKKMLEFKLQPYVAIRFNKYLYDIIKIPSKPTIALESNVPESNVPKSNVPESNVPESNIPESNIPFIPDIPVYDNNCSNQIYHNSGYSHAVNLRKWTSNYIDLKNSWGTRTGNKGNFSVKDLKYLICKSNKYIYFGSLMFRYEKILDSNIKARLDSILSSYEPTVDQSLDLKEEGDISLDSYGLLNGNGTLVDLNGTYTGDFMNGFFHGNGIMNELDGSEYNGRWKNGKKDGNGRIKYADEDVYNGEWKEDMYHGYGEIEYSDGEVYKGEWKFDYKNGHGMLKYPDGSIYSGQWKFDYRDGRGMIKYPDETVYKGNWFKDKRHGNGEMIYLDGSIYQGQWFKDKRHGNGILYNSDKIILYEGEWKNDKQVNPNTNYKMKYIKYKIKYINLLNQLNQSNH